jgi:hypothetical protein
MIGIFFCVAVFSILEHKYDGQTSAGCWLKLLLNCMRCRKATFILSHSTANMYTIFRMTCLINFRRVLTEHLNARIGGSIF